MIARPCVRACVRACVCVCVREREREGGRKEREGGRGPERGWWWKFKTLTVLLTCFQKTKQKKLLCSADKALLE